MADFPRSLREFQKCFPNDAACASYLAAKRWPDGFRCPQCGEAKYWHLPSRAMLTFLCAKCRKETSVTAGTVMHRSHLPLTVWFWSAFLMATHSNGISALQLSWLVPLHYRSDVHPELANLNERLHYLLGG